MRRNRSNQLFQYIQKAIILGSAWRKVDSLQENADATAFREIIATLPKAYRKIGDKKNEAGKEFLHQTLEAFALEVRELRPWYIAWIVPITLGSLFLLLALGYGGMIAHEQLSNEGFKVTYYRGVHFDEQLFTWTERKAFLDYKSGSPARGVPEDRFSATWEGVLHVPDHATYSFFAQSDDGVRLYIDNALIIDFWSEHGWIPGKHGQATLQEGPHKIKIEYYDLTGNAALRIRWTGGSIPANSVIGVPYVTKK